MRRTARLIVLAVVLAASSAHAQLGSPKAIVSAHLDRSALEAGKDAAVAVVVDLPLGYHAQSSQPLQKDLIAFAVTLDAGPWGTPAPPVYPPGHIENYPQLGKTSVYTGRIIAYVPLRAASDAQPGPVVLSGSVRYQMCDDEGRCLFPEQPKFTIQTRIAAAGERVERAHRDIFRGLETGAVTRPATTVAAPTTKPLVATTRAVADSQEADDGERGDRSPNWPYAVALGVAFLAGLFFNIMPCVLPVLPIKALGFFEVAQHDRAKSLLLGFIFSLGLVSVFLVLAVLIVALKWLKWGEQFSNPYFAWGAVIVFVAMATGLLGLFNVRLPTGVYSLSPRHDTYAGNFLLGALTAVLSTPCTAPLFPSLLLFAASQPVALGVLAMFMVGVGMASPYVLLSAFPELARRFPRTGPFSELVKQMMAFLLLGAAAYFAGGRLFAWPHFWWLVVAVGAAAAVFLVVRTLQLTRRPVAIAVSSVIALALVAGPLWWTISLLGATWRPFDAQVFERERQAGRVVLVKFTANWCLNCQYLEGTVFRDERVVSAIRRNGVIAMKADLTHEGAPGNALLAQITPSGGIPLTAIFTPHRPKPILLGGTFTTPSLLKELARATGG